jgi:hypothetical protein
MHKSIIFLLGLLTLLIPVGPSMSNSNVMAFEDYGYEAHQYENMQRIWQMTITTNLIATL